MVLPLIGRAAITAAKLLAKKGTKEVVKKATSARKQKANQRRKRVRQEKRYERALDEAMSGRGTNPKTARKMLQKEAIRRHKAYTGDEPW